MYLSNVLVAAVSQYYAAIVIVSVKACSKYYTSPAKWFVLSLLESLQKAISSNYCEVSKTGLLRLMG